MGNQPSKNIQEVGGVDVGSTGGLPVRIVDAAGATSNSDASPVLTAQSSAAFRTDLGNITDQTDLLRALVWEVRMLRILVGDIFDTDHGPLDALDEDSD